MTSALAGLCAACSVLSFPSRTAKRRLEALLPHVPRGPRWRRLRASQSWQSLGPALAVGILGALFFRSPILAALLPLAVWRGHQTWLNREARVAADRRREETVALCLAFRAELRGGLNTRLALRNAAESACPALAAQLVGPLDAGDDIIPVLRTAAKQPGGEALAYLAACWHASEGGAGLSRAVGRLAQTLRSAQAQRREVAAELAAVRASARLLAILPSAGVVLGSGMGAAPMHVLFHTVVGQTCLAAGVGCVLSGLAWMNLIVRSAEIRT